MAEILFSFDVCVCVCVCVQRTGQSDQFVTVKAMDFKSNLTCMFPGTVRTLPLEFFRKGGVARSRDPLNFWALNHANSSKTVKATDFKFDVHVSRDSPHMTLEKFFEKVASVKIHLAEI